MHVIDLTSDSIRIRGELLGTWHLTVYRPDKPDRTIYLGDRELQAFLLLVYRTPSPRKELQTAMAYAHKIIDPYFTTDGELDSPY